MCGIAGTFSASPRAAKESDVLSALRHRGPDSSGHCSLDGNRLHMYHMRLSIQDLSPAGHQPMVSACGRYTIVFNGEIYNFIALANELRRAGRSLRGHSDTEVLLEYLSMAGPERTLAAISGMFAFAVFDHHTQELHLVRDRLGEKPLYWSVSDGVLFFSSEIKGLFAAGMATPSVDVESLWLFFRYGYIPQPHSIFSDVSKVEPGSWMTFSIGSGVVECSSNRRYWSASDVAQAARSAPVGSRGSALDTLDALLINSVEQQSIADVDVGVFLSGGVDSSLVAALLSKVAPRKVKSFTVAFDQADFDESVFARQIAAHLGTDHRQVHVGESELLEIVTELPSIYDEPIANASQIPAIILSRFAAEHVKVCLSGDGGDELFGGYNRYAWGAKLDGWRSLLPSNLSRPLGGLFDGSSRRGLPSAMTRLLGGPVQDMSTKLAKLGGALQCTSPDGVYEFLISNWMVPPVAATPATLTARCPDGIQGFRSRAMLLDQLFYLPGDNLAKVDRASMACSLEVRLPLLSHEILEFAWRIPESEHFRGAQKSLLREVLYRHVPRALIERPKMGFTVPLAGWLRGPLKQWAADLLGSRSLYEGLPIDSGPIMREWATLQGGHDAPAWRIWAVISFLSWRARWSC